MLDRAHFSPGVIDGRWGKNTEKAVYWLQEELGWEPSGEADRRLFDLLSRHVGSESPVRQYTVTAEDVAGPFVTIPEEPEDQAELDCLCYESAEELLAERFHVTPELLAQLNPGVDLAAVRAGQSLWVPNVAVVEEDPGAPDRVARIVVSRSGFYVQGLDDSGAILYHFPSTLGSEYDPSPSGGYSVAAHAYDPNFHYQPELFSEVPDEEADLLLPPGPNSPVGLVWLDLSKPNFGIHGTSEPSTIGYATSHGCIRLTNWDAVFLANHVAEGTPVEFRE
jgi:lipoprotein-anchoring transpeptidase ErfK/SrfK